MSESETRVVGGRVGRLGERAAPAVLAVAVVAGSLWSATDRVAAVDAAAFLDLDRDVVAVVALVLAVAGVAAAWWVPRGLMPLATLALAGWVSVSMWPPVVVASYFAAAAPRRRGRPAVFAVTAGAAVAGPAAIAAAFGAVGAGRGTAQGALGGVVLFVALPMVVGLWVRERRKVVAGLRERAARLERERTARGEQARARERARIAREMHDVVAHRVSLLVVRATALQVNAPDGSVAAEAAALRSTGREALTELRAVLGVLRSPGGSGDGDPLGPQPTLRDLDALLERSRAVGTPIDRRDEGDPRELPVLVERTAYRVVQEGLTNVHRHAGGAPTGVVLDYSPEELVVTVGNTAPERGESPLPASGLGLAGLRERVELLNGELISHPREDGGFTLSARLPVTGAAERE